MCQPRDSAICIRAGRGSPRHRPARPAGLPRIQPPCPATRRGGSPPASPTLPRRPGRGHRHPASGRLMRDTSQKCLTYLSLTRNSVSSCTAILRKERDHDRRVPPSSTSPSPAAARRSPPPPPRATPVRRRPTPTPSSRSARTARPAGRHRRRVRPRRDALTVQRAFATAAIALVKEAGETATAQASAAGETIKARTEEAHRARDRPRDRDHPARRHRPHNSGSRLTRAPRSREFADSAGSGSCFWILISVGTARPLAAPSSFGNRGSP